MYWYILNMQFIWVYLFSINYEHQWKHCLPVLFASCCWHSRMHSEQKKNNTTSVLSLDMTLEPWDATFILMQEYLIPRPQKVSDHENCCLCVHIFVCLSANILKKQLMDFIETLKKKNILKCTSIIDQVFGVNLIKNGRHNSLALINIKKAVSLSISQIMS